MCIDIVVCTNVNSWNSIVETLVVLFAFSAFSAKLTRGRTRTLKVLPRLGTVHVVHV